SGGNLTIRTVRAGGAIRVIFDDTGCGMTAEEMRRLFDPFHSTKDNETHLGLGLFVSHEIVRQHGGDLLVESQPGVGSTVTVVLLRKARALQPRTPVVLITAFATVDTAVEALREGASDYVIKPLKFDELRHRVQGLLEHRPAFQESALFRRAVESAAPDGGLL